MWNRVRLSGALLLLAGGLMLVDGLAVFDVKAVPQNSNSSTTMSNANMTSGNSNRRRARRRHRRRRGRRG